MDSSFMYKLTLSHLPLVLQWNWKTWGPLILYRRNPLFQTGQGCWMASTVKKGPYFGLATSLTPTLWIHGQWEYEAHLCFEKKPKGKTKAVNLASFVLGAQIIQPCTQCTFFPGQAPRIYFFTYKLPQEAAPSLFLSLPSWALLQLLS